MMNHTETFVFFRINKVESFGNMKYKEVAVIFA